MSDAWKNYAESVLASGITAGATSITLNTGDGSKFPDEDRMCVIFDAAAATPSDDSTRELVKISSRSGDVLTVTRAQESTSAKAWDASDKIWHVATAGEFTNDFRQIVQTVLEEWETTASTTAQIEDDDDIPESSEGAIVFDPQITPKNAANIIDYEVVIHIALNAGDQRNVIIAAFKGSATEADAATLESLEKFDKKMLRLTGSFVAGGTSAITLNVRWGLKGTGTLYLNSDASGNRLLGGAMRSYVRLTERAPYTIITNT
jgi:hypothetical protein